MGELMVGSHLSLRDDYEVSCSQLDLLVELARGIGIEGGVFGSRMTGGGFGGCTVSLVLKNKVEEVSRKICEDYRREAGLEPTLFVTRPAEGAMILRPLKP